MITTVFSKKERHEIYKKAYELFLRKKTTGMCINMETAIGIVRPDVHKKIKNETDYLKMIDMLPEFLSIKPASALIFKHWWVDGPAHNYPYSHTSIFMRSCMFQTIIERTKTI